MRGFGFPEIVFRPLANFAEKVELAVAFRTSEPSASVRAFIVFHVASFGSHLERLAAAAGSQSDSGPSTTP